MLTRRVRIQVVLFIVIALATTAFVGANYAGLGRLFGSGSYTVKLELAEGGGLFTNGEVTYRGVAVGRVGELRLTLTGTEADLLIDDGAPPIPADSKAVVANRSAVGEQYVDLQPRTSGGPFLTGDSVIQRESTTLPLPVNSLLTDLDSFTASVPTQDLRTVVDELDDALRGAGPDLQTLMDSATTFTQEASAHLPQTSKLIGDGATVLRTQVDSSAEWRSFSGNARVFAQQLAKSDGDLRRLIATAPPAATELSSLLKENDPGLPIVLANLLTTARVFGTRTAAEETLLANVPRAVAAVGSAIDNDRHELRMGLVLNFNNPPSCLQGYEDTPHRSSRDLSPLPLNTDAACTLPYGNESSVRGTQNAPHPPVPDAVPVGPLTIGTQATNTTMEEMLWLR
ncbi:phospholipid/cholesterol/gamma-HCH transport system substrate-binding protein [Amycolatopsis lexingtonensis]|uniref:Phospholipid/cholesterol/gamma-HCH transport system substrate-binding protein n=1 Tax=Amycolatopsis lexingtonensis TaxID=218822 RepID=A0ABR9I3M2_9PSEU|nr:MlaD family protein [Amycolatopsis lexingtonensis]MBE1497806.1 phospholipid/cholesterol/gamma-HCH transport system substrate-binding protein [Amycolatopsis lexingtonensis]